MEPVALAADTRDNTVYVADRLACRVRRVDGRTGVITTLAGTGQKGFAGDNGPAAEARFRDPHDLLLDGRGGLLVADVADGRIRRIDLRTGVITTWAGTGQRERTGDGGPFARAGFAGPRALARDARDGTIFVCEREATRSGALTAKRALSRSLAARGRKATPATVARPKTRRSTVPRACCATRAAICLS
jgi:sugar lactone lactonase YvrE